MDGSEEMVPHQESGFEKNIREQVLFDDETDAEDFFVIAKDRLLDVNNWQEYAGGFGAVFQLTDGHGHELKRQAHRGDYIRINIPGPGTATGDGYDWVRIEAIEYDDYPDTHEESMALKVRAASNPQHTEDVTAHFFHEEATSTFIIHREHGKVTASIHGRNEKPNTDTGKILDDIRNTAVAAGAVIGISNLQWGQLARGLIRINER